MRSTKLTRAPELPLGATADATIGQSVSVREVLGIPIGLVGRITAGQDSGLYIEVDDDTERPRGSGGYYLLLWDASKSADEWYATAEDLRYAFEGRPVEWFSAEDSAVIPGRHRPGTQKIPAGWYADRPGRHEKRYWDGDLWTAEVSDDGVTGLDPLDRDGR